MICYSCSIPEIMQDVIRATTAQNKTPGKLEWRVLVVDMQSMRMVSACTKMHELSAEGITSNYKTKLLGKALVFRGGYNITEI